MCGIIGYIGSRECAPIILDGLKKLEYRGYDSAGLAALKNGKVEIRRVEGKLSGLENSLREQPLSGKGAHAVTERVLFPPGMDHVAPRQSEVGHARAYASCVFDRRDRPKRDLERRRAPLPATLPLRHPDMAPYVPTSDQYIYDSFEIQIYDAALDVKTPVMHEGAATPTNDPMLHITGAVYDAKAPDKAASKPTGQWNHYKITAKGLDVTIELNGEVVNQWQLKPAGKVATCWPAGYVGLQNHEPSIVHFANIRAKEL